MRRLCPTLNSLPKKKGGGAGGQFLIGMMYTMGNGVPRDYKAEFKWYKRPTERWHADTQIALSDTYAAIEDDLTA